MKTFLLSIALLTGIAATAQVAFDWDPSQDIITSVDNNDYTQIYINQNNLTGDTLNLEIEIIYTDVPAGWDGMICVYGLCLGGIPAVGFTSPMSPVSGTTQGYVRWTVNPMGGTETGEVHVRVYDADNPTDGDTCKFIITGALGIQDYSASGDFEVYPNPANDFISLSNQENLDQVKIYSLDGKMVEQYSILAEKQNIDISDLPAGMYFLHGFSSGTLIGTRKIVIK